MHFPPLLVIARPFGISILFPLSLATQYPAARGRRTPPGFVSCSSEVEPLAVSGRRQVSFSEEACSRKGSKLLGSRFSQVSRQGSPGRLRGVDIPKTVVAAPRLNLLHVPLPLSNMSPDGQIHTRSN